MKKAVIMCRVSSDEQTHGYSLDVQFDALNNHCQRNDILLAEIKIASPKLLFPFLQLQSIQITKRYIL